MLFNPTNYHPYDFANRRHIGPTPEEIKGMLDTLGFSSLEDLVQQTVPKDVQSKVELNFGKAFSERALLGEMQRIAKKNKVFTSLIGMGYHGTFTPPVIQRNIFENPAWYTAYTPYQPEISQGRLEALLNFQTMIIDLTGLPVANASLLDEATAAAEAMGMAWRTAKNKSDKFFVDENCHPQNINVMRTRAEPLGIELVIGDPSTLDATDVCGAIFQYPNTNGEIFDYTDAMSALHDNGALGVMIADPMALALLREPGAMGADIAVGSTQRFGVPMGYGGPHAAYMACTDGLKRSMPGRIIGVSVDARGNTAYRLALQTREQHIRREKATSNVCTAQALLAVMASFYGVFHGPDGLKAIAQRIHRKTVRLVRGFEAAGLTVENRSFFDTVVVNVGARQSEIMAAAYAREVNLRKIGADRIGISLDEITTGAVIEKVWAAFGIDRQDIDLNHEYRIDEAHYRTSDYMTHPTFHRNRSETEMMRYMRRLADRDLALDRAMIPLGSCTMKLNAAVEMIPVSWPEFNAIHPYAPADQTEGYKELIDDLAQKLTVATGYDAMSMQPNSGAQGEYAGLLTIAAYHKSRGEGHRNICLIPSSAHGTNPATASMVGWKVVVVGSDESGDIDLEDFRAKAEQYGNDLAATMITYPSTHGVFEASVNEIARITHEYGGQVYIDGANMNAMVGIARPGDIGGDVSHLNLHKTFAIPHGGGGPGMGPIGVKAHLAPFLPSDPVANDGPAGPVAAAPFGSASILPISWAYIRAMGGEGLKQSSLIAILSANYIAKRLEGAYEILYRGQNDRVAHECIIDTRPFEKSAGVTVDDVAKRLVDTGFHAPTMSWPVAGTLMIEPTESESKAELDRFCDAMLHIRGEIRAIEEGKMDREDNPLKNAPHTVEDLVAEWTHPYTREEGVFPAGSPRRDKFWPAVARVDNVAGDRNFFCSCPAVVKENA